MDSERDAQEKATGVHIISSYDEDWAYSDNVQEFACGDTKHCTVCREEKPVLEFDRNGQGYRGECKACRSRKRNSGRIGDITREDILDRVADKLIARMAL